MHLTKGFDLMPVESKSSKGRSPPNRLLRRKMTVIAPSAFDKDIPRKTQSLCPECGKTIIAELYEDDGKIMMKKACADHGEVVDVYFSDAEMFRKFQGFAIDGVGVKNPHTKSKDNCPNDCGLCEKHLTHSGIVNIDLTNRCNLTCPICFANANAAGFVYEPEYEDFVRMLKMCREMKPVPVQAVQFSGGEPTIHPRFFDILSAARDAGVPQIQIATNGIELGKDPSFAQKCNDAGLHTVYLQFDTFKEDNIVKIRNKKGLLKEKLQAIENCRKVKPSPLTVVLVPTMVRGVNDDEVGKLITFAFEKIDVVRAVNFQPVSFSGRIDQEERIKGRYTIADLIKDSVAQTDFLTKDDWYPVPVVAGISEVISLYHGEPKLAFTCHPACGAACYVFQGEDGKRCGVSQFIDIQGMYEDALRIADDLKDRERFQRVHAAFKMMKLLKYVDKERMPKGMNVRNLIRDVISQGNKESMGKLQWKVLMLGSMHFMDRYNYDVERAKRCAVHYATPDGRLIPFCSYNTGHIFRTEVEKKYSMSFKEYNEKRAKRP